MKINSLKMKKGLITGLMFLSVGAVSLNASAEDYISEARSTVLDGSFQSQLQQYLSSEDYNAFYANLQDFSAPYTLRNGSRYFEARRDNLNAASAIVLDKNGLFYLAYKKPNSNKIVYVTNDERCNQEVHDAIKVFAKILQDNPEIVFSEPVKTKNQNKSCSNIYGLPTIKNRRFERASTSETTAQKNTRKVAESIWGQSVTRNWNINPQVTTIVGQAVNSIRTCSANFSLVPKPPAYGTIPGAKYFVKYAYQVVKYNTALKKNRSYRTCVIATARNFRSAAEAASLGI